MPHTLKTSETRSLTHTSAFLSIVMLILAAALAAPSSDGSADSLGLVPRALLFLFFVTAAVLTFGKSRVTINPEARTLTFAWQGFSRLDVHQAPQPGRLRNLFKWKSFSQEVPMDDVLGVIVEYRNIGRNQLAGLCLELTTEYLPIPGPFTSMLFNKGRKVHRFLKKNGLVLTYRRQHVSVRENEHLEMLQARALAGRTQSRTA